MIITISGLDGSGKSTQIDLVKDYFKKKGFHCRLRHLIKDSLTYFLTHRVIGKISRKTKANVEEGIRKKTKDVSFYLLAAIKKLLLLIELLYFNARYGWLKGSASHILICDRYYYDALVQIKFLGIAGKVFCDIYKKMIVAPDFSFYLKVDPYTAYERKREFDIDYFTKKSKLYDKVIPDSAVVFDSGTIEEVQGRIQEIVNRT